MADWNDIVLNHGPSVYRAAFRVLGHVEDCEDVVQDVFAEAYTSFREGEVLNWRALLLRLATFRALDRLRKRQETFPVEVELILESTHDPQHIAMRIELEQRLRQQVSELPPRQAEVFCLVHFEGMTHEAVAESLQISSNAVAIALHKARVSLRGHFLETPEEVKDER